MTTLAELGEISKASDGDIPPGYRSSALQRINPRSRTYVREGSAPQRVLLPWVGGISGALAGRGAVLAATRGKVRSPNTLGAAHLAGVAGGSLTTTAALHRNIKSKDTISIHRKSGRRARSKVDIPSVGHFNVY